MNEKNKIKTLYFNTKIYFYKRFDLARLQMTLIFTLYASRTVGFGYINMYSHFFIEIFTYNNCWSTNVIVQHSNREN